ncbi:MAG TPA: SDR family NAD(P)-dependent oxidoreductase [Polyangiaceae bacterium]
MPGVDLRGRVAVVTGAAKGIGRATALELAAAGALVGACDLDEAALEATLAECRALSARATLGARVDVADADAMQAFADRIERELGPSFCLVNNAGVGLAGGFFDTEPADWEWLLRTNLWGTINGVRAFGPRLRERRAGRIVNVASAAGFCNQPSLTAYGTTKHAVVGLSEALRAELFPSGVRVSVVCPGFIATSILDGARMRGAADTEQKRSALREFYQRRAHPPEIVARAIVGAARSGRALVPVTSEAWLLYLLKRAVPSTLPWLLRAAERMYHR